MTPCPTCGRELGPSARFCGSCGTPVAQQQQQQRQQPQQQPQQPTPPQYQQPQQYQQYAEPQTAPQPLPSQPYPSPQAGHNAPRGLLLPIVVGATVVAVIAAAVVVFVLPHFTNSAQPTLPTVTANSSSAPASTTTAEPTTTTTTPPTTTPTAATVADLTREVANDHATAETLVGQWVPQISSKKPGLVVGGVTFGYPEIMADFQSLKGRFPQAVMVNSNDYVNFSGKDFWVTLAAIPFGSADEANAWCDQQGFATQDCYASRLTHTGGPAGNSKTR